MGYFFGGRRCSPIDHPFDSISTYRAWKWARFAWRSLFWSSSNRSAAEFDCKRHCKIDRSTVSLRVCFYFSCEIRARAFTLDFKFWTNEYGWFLFCCEYNVFRAIQLSSHFFIGGHSIHFHTIVSNWLQVSIVRLENCLLLRPRTAATLKRSYFVYIYRKPADYEQ